MKNSISFLNFPLKSIFSALLIAAALSACSKDPEPSPSTPAPSNAPAEPSSGPATPNNMPTEPSSSANTSANLPAECDTYLKKVDACISKLGANNPGAAAFKQSMDQARQQWASMMGDKDKLAEMCKQANDAFAQAGSGIGCN